jgi:hypothetical protein
LNHLRLGSRYLEIIGHDAQRGAAVAQMGSQIGDILVGHVQGLVVQRSCVATDRGAGQHSRNQRQA